MSGFCISTGETHISKKGNFCHSKQNENYKNESYLTQYHIKAFQDIKLVSHYLKSVNRENSKCLDFVSVQVKHIVHKGPFFLSYQTECKTESYLTH